MLYDLSPPIGPDLKVWPGDTPPRREIVQDISAGAGVDLSALHSTVHVGSHADAPSHTATGSPSIGDLPLEPFLGPCEVIRIAVGPRGRVLPSHVPGRLRAERVLFATGTFPDPTRFTDDFAALSPDLVEDLAARGVVLVGIDTPGVDLFDSSDLPVHAALRRAGIVALEGLVLEGVPEGVYELIALPLALAGFDASPVRAVLRTLEGRLAPGGRSQYPR